MPYEDNEQKNKHIRQLRRSIVSDSFDLYFNDFNSCLASQPTILKLGTNVWPKHGDLFLKRDFVTLQCLDYI